MTRLCHSFGTMGEWLFAKPERWFGLLFAGALLLTAAAFVLEYGMGILPCKMCWWQRYVHWALGLIALVGLLWKDRCGRTSCAIALAGTALIGLYIAGWQVGAQQGWLPFPPSCTGWGQTLAGQAGDLLGAMRSVQLIPCDKETYTLLGLSLAAWNLPIMLGYMVVAILGGQRLR